MVTAITGVSVRAYESGFALAAAFGKRSAGTGISIRHLDVRSGGSSRAVDQLVIACTESCQLLIVELFHINAEVLLGSAVTGG